MIIPIHIRCHSPGPLWKSGWLACQSEASQVATRRCGDYYEAGLELPRSGPVRFPIVYYGPSELIALFRRKGRKAVVRLFKAYSLIPSITQRT